MSDDELKELDTMIKEYKEYLKENPNDLGVKGNLESAKALREEMVRIKKGERMTVYIIEKYEFWDGGEIIYMSDNYNRSLSLFKELKNSMATGTGLHLRRYELNVLKRSCIENIYEDIWWVEKDYDGNWRIIHELNEDVE